tara:strand:- start:1574 stop:1855 length:282 start_codon:yes stop_codon:yes gene_type:complete
MANSHVKGASVRSLERKKMILEDVVDDLENSHSTLDSGELYWSPNRSGDFVGDDDIDNAQDSIEEAVNNIMDSKLWADGEKLKKRKRKGDRLI